MLVLEYKNHPVKPKGMKTPDFIQDGGYWFNKIDNTYIGLVADDVEYYVPDTVTTYTLAELQARQRAIHAKYPFIKLDYKDQLDYDYKTGELNDYMTDDEVNAWVKVWWDDRS